MSDRQWTIFLGIAAIVAGIIIYIFAEVQLTYKIIIVLGEVLCISLIINFVMWIRSTKVQPSVNNYYKEMGVALRELLNRHPAKVRVCSYIGNFTVESICAANYPNNLELRLLVRDPGSRQWSYPPIKSRRQKLQKDRILRDVIDRLTGDEVANRLAHNRLQAPHSSWVRFFSHEPVLRCIVADFPDGKRTGYFGFYRLQQRPSILDYSGRGRPVIHIDDAEPYGKALLDDYVNWFDHYWENIALMEPSNT